ncbi:zf-HC2 domain-containing protein [Brevibacillus sp. SYSU BS000544]|uniref:zf-HC2 domain-containing protein n=1 Tax=Brevibacillus sp. SYSU BS000544 TaxID=3416443 RepID=UPI003CE50BB4
MKCEEVQDLIIEYTDQKLPELTKRRVDQHLDTCESCSADYEVWMESSTWLPVEKDLTAQVASSKSIVDSVMARILSEEKWAIPIGRKVFTLTARMRQFGASAAVILLMLSAFAVFSNSTQETYVAGVDVGTTTSKTQVVSSEISTSEGIVEVVSDLPTTEVTEIASPPVIIDNNQSVPTGPNYTLIIGFFGILITVIGSSWLMRVEKR